MKPAKLLLACVLVAVFASGCATGMLASWRNKIRHPGKEIQGDNGALTASYTGDSEIKGTKYATIILHNPRVSCNDNSEVKLLLPLGSDNNAVPLLQEIKKTDVVTGGKRVDIVHADNVLAAKDLPRVLSRLPPWEGYPGAVVLDQEGLVDSFQFARPVVVYRYGAGQDNVMVQVVSSELSWVCRSKRKRILSIVAYPFAIPLDIVTAPGVYVAYEIGINLHRSD